MLSLITSKAIDVSISSAGYERKSKYCSSRWCSAETPIAGLRNGGVNKLNLLTSVHSNPNKVVLTGVTSEFAGGGTEQHLEKIS